MFLNIIVKFIGVYLRSQVCVNSIGPLVSGLTMKRMTLAIHMTENSIFKCLKVSKIDTSYLIKPGIFYGTQANILTPAMKQLNVGE